tara:strand:- start:286 stop:1458 length:1173 start_codon:yes stop_codon:yes gene_type:complete
MSNIYPDDPSQFIDGKPVLSINSNRKEILEFLKKHKKKLGLKTTEKGKRKTIDQYRKELEAGGHFIGVAATTNKSTRGSKKAPAVQAKLKKEEDYKQLITANPQGFNVKNVNTMSLMGFTREQLIPPPPPQDEIAMSGFGGMPVPSELQETIDTTSAPVLVLTRPYTNKSNLDEEEEEAFNRDQGNVYPWFYEGSKGHSAGAGLKFGEGKGEYLRGLDYAGHPYGHTAGKGESPLMTFNVYNLDGELIGSWMPEFMSGKYAAQIEFVTGPENHIRSSGTGTDEQIMAENRRKKEERAAAEKEYNKRVGRLGEFERQSEIGDALAEFRRIDIKGTAEDRTAVDASGRNFRERGKDAINEINKKYGYYKEEGLDIASRSFGTGGIYGGQRWY